MDPNLAPMPGDAGVGGWWNLDDLGNFAGDLLSYVDMIGMDGIA